MNITSLFETPILRSIETLNFQYVIGHIPILRALELKHFLSAPFFGLVILISYISWLYAASAPVVKGPVAGYRSFLDPTFLLRIRFIFSAVGIMNNGYHKVTHLAFALFAYCLAVRLFQKFKNSYYVIRRMDTDVTILATKYLHELRNIDVEELNYTRKYPFDSQNVLGAYTNLEEMKANHNFVKVISHHLNPNINEFMKYIQDELDYSFKVDMPNFEGHEWKPVYIYGLLRRIISRVASRVMLGLPYCRDDTMVSITEPHTISIFGVIFILRRFPPVFHPLIALLIPYRWMIWWNIRKPKKVTQRVIDDLLAAEASGDTSSDSKKEKALLKWIIDNAEPQYKSLDSLVSTQLAASVAAVYTSSQVTSHMLAFLAQNPQYITELREEIAESTNDNGSIDISKLHKLEAYISETLRMSPPQINAPQRRALQDATLKDGVVIPKGALIGFPCVPAGMDPSIYPEPHKFVPFRKENLSSPVTTPTRSQLAFGWGSQASPGRFFAAKEIKVLTARLLMEYDIEVVPGARRYYDIEDFRILNPTFKLCMRRRNPKA